LSPAYNSKSFDDYLARATAYAFLQDMNHALADFSEAIQINPNNSETYLLRGNVYKAMGDIERAEADFAKPRSYRYFKITAEMMKKGRNWLGRIIFIYGHIDDLY
jgi:tetratricopeptide (TPR) repeat protein